MKYSQFNSLIAYKKNFALYNSFTKKVIFLEPTLKDILQAAIQEGVDELGQVHPSFYQYLLKHHYLVADDTDEVAKVKARSKMVDENIDDFVLTINPSMNCNFKCWYCYETHVKNSHLVPDTMGRINTFINKTADKVGMKNFSLSLFGGEPLLYFKKEVIPVVDTYIAACKRNGLKPDIFITTNGYLIDEDFIAYFKQQSVYCGLQITLDGYKEKHDLVRFVSAKKGSYEKIIENVRLLITNGFFVRLRINYTDKNVDGTYQIADEFRDIAEDIKKSYLIMDYHRVWQDEKIDNTFSVVDENIGKINELGVPVTSKYSPNNVENSCYADKRNSAVINFNGDIFKCTARDFTTAKRAGYLNEAGELVWENNYLERRMDIKFRNKPCLSCKIMPLCNGGCSQHALEHFEAGTEYCVHSGDENEKMNIVRTKIDEIVGALSKATV